MWKIAKFLFEEIRSMVHLKMEDCYLISVSHHCIYIIELFEILCN